MTETRKNLRVAVLVAIVAALLAGAALAFAEPADAAISKAAKKKAKTYTKSKNKIFKVKGAKYCFSKKKVRTGYKKVGSHYYFFSKSTGKMTKKKTVKVGSKYYFFKSNGRRYKYAIKNTGTSKGNSAAGLIVSAAKLKPSSNPSAAVLKKVHAKIVKHVKYAYLIQPSMSSKSAIGKLAYTAAMDKKGICFNYAALEYVTFKALGAKPRVWSGKCNRNPGDSSSKAGQHAWVTVAGSGDAPFLLYDPVYDRGKSASALKFCRVPFAYDSEASAYKADGINYLYYKSKTF